MKQSTLLGALFGLVSTVAAVKPVEVKGSQFVNTKTNDRFQMIGVDYQPGGAGGYKTESKEDPLSDADVCLRDAILLQRLGVNTIRIYNINPALDHDECVSIYNAAGIYFLLDVSTPMSGEHLNREEPASTYNEDFLTRIFSVVEAFKDYPNLLGLFAGNEIINEDAHKDVPAYIRAIQRDLKDYIAEHADRAIPVGYSAADIREILEDTWSYVSCELEDSPTSKADFFGINSYSWCGDATYTTSEYDKLVEMFTGSSNPIFFSEYGCNKVTPRKFTEVEAVYGEKMTQAMCGGLIYEYSQEKNKYGLVELEDDTATLLVDYDNLMKQHNKLDIERLQSLDPSTTQIKPPKCDSKLIKSGDLLSKFKIPKLPKGGEKLIKDGVKGANKGKIVEVTETKLKSKVVDKDGKEITGLELKIISNDGGNIPGDNDSGNSPSKKDGAKDDDEDSGAGMKQASVGIASLAAGLTLLSILLA